VSPEISQANNEADIEVEVKVCGEGRKTWFGKYFFLNLFMTFVLGIADISLTITPMSYSVINI
jgi:hypothetical protein